MISYELCLNLSAWQWNEMPLHALADVCMLWQMSVLVQICKSTMKSFDAVWVVQSVTLCWHILRGRLSFLNIFHTSKPLVKLISSWLNNYMGEKGVTVFVGSAENRQKCFRSNTLKLSNVLPFEGLLLFFENWEVQKFLSSKMYFTFLKRLLHFA